MKGMAVSFWDIVWFMIIFFAFATYLMVLFSIITDLFRDRELSGGMRVVWLVLLFLFTMITAVVYLITRGKGMTERSLAAASDVKQAQDDYIRSVAASGSGGAGAAPAAHPAEQIAKAKELLDNGTISQEEFATLKQKAMA